MPIKPTSPERIRTGFENAARTGKINDAEAEALIRSVRRDRLTASEMKAFKLQVSRFKDKFTPSAEALLTEFIEKKAPKLAIFDPGPKPNPGGLADPKVLAADVDRVRQLHVEGGTLFRDGVSGDDPRQNALADCYLLGAMSAVAKQRPEVIERMFKANPDGSYTVTLYDKKGSKLVPHKVTVDADLPRNDWLGNRYAYSRDTKELWPALLEKAFAARAGGYAKIEGGFACDAMEEMTGKKSYDVSLRGEGVTPESAFAEIKAAVDAGKPGVAVTYGEASNAKYTNSGVFSDHAYTVWGTSEAGGKKYVHLRNPWGDTEPAGNGRDDGIFKLELSQFIRLFYNASFNG